MKLITMSLQGLLLVTVAVATSAADGDEPSHLRYTGYPGYPLYSVNITDPSSMSEGKTFISIGSSIIERGVCEITESCKRAGGHCVEKKKDCSGAVDKRTCLGRKCMCCMPDVVKGCRPSLSCYSAGGHCVRNGGDCESGVLDQSGCIGKNCKCCLPPSDYLTTTTTEEQTTTATNYDLPRVYLDDEAFVPFNESMPRFEAQDLCRSYGLDLYHPNNISAVAEYLKDNGYAPWFWLGARGNGSNQLWDDDGTVLPGPDALWLHGFYNVGTGACTAMVATTYAGSPPGYLFNYDNSCTSDSLDIRPLCG